MELGTFGVRVVLSVPSLTVELEWGQNWMMQCCSLLSCLTGHGQQTQADDCTPASSVSVTDRCDAGLSDGLRRQVMRTWLIFT